MPAHKRQSRAEHAQHATLTQKGQREEDRLTHAHLQLRLARTTRNENEDETKPISRLRGAATRAN